MAAPRGGRAGGRRDPTLVRIGDLANAMHDQLLSAVRRELRANHGFPKFSHPMNVECVFSAEPPVFPQPDGSVCTSVGGQADLRLDCITGFGTAAFVTGAFGLAAAAQVVHQLTITN